MDAFRYAQACPLARAAEVVGQRWTLLVLRELFVGPQRFSDLRRRLRGISPSVLSARLEQLEGLHIVTRRTLPPPAASTVYALTDEGRELEPVMLALTRWGLRWLVLGVPGDHFEPEWMRIGLQAMARRESTPARRFALHVATDDGREACVRIGGGPGGTRLLEDTDAVDAELHGSAPLIMALLAGLLPTEQVLANPDLEVRGDAAAVAELPALFDFPDLAPPAPG